MIVPIRIDEADKTPSQIIQRERTYEAARLLKAAGFDVTVQEYFTGSDKRANAAGIIVGKVTE